MNPQLIQYVGKLAVQKSYNTFSGETLGKSVVQRQEKVMNKLEMEIYVWSSILRNDTTHVDLQNMRRLSGVGPYLCLPCIFRECSSPSENHLLLNFEQLFCSHCIFCDCFKMNLFLFACTASHTICIQVVFSTMTTLLYFCTLWRLLTQATCKVPLFHCKSKMSSQDRFQAARFMLGGTQQETVELPREAAEPPL